MYTLVVKSVKQKSNQKVFNTFFKILIQLIEWRGQTKSYTVHADDSNCTSEISNVEVQSVPSKILESNLKILIDYQYEKTTL